MSGTVILKATAALLLIGSGYFFGKSMDKKLKERTETYKNMAESVVYLKSKICQEAYTLPEAMSATAAKFCRYPHSLYEKTSYYMVSEGMDGQQAWKRACSDCAEGKLLGEEGISLLEETGKLLGCGDRDMQKENLEALWERLKNACAASEEKQKRDGSLYIKLGLAAGCIAAILMW